MSSESTIATIVGNISTTAPEYDAPNPMVPGTFGMQVLDYEFPETTSGSDANWLVVLSTWSGPSMQIRLRGPYVTTHELDDFLRSIAALLDGRMGVASSRFLEPNLKIHLYNFVHGDTEGFEMELEIYGEPAMAAEHFNVSMHVERSDLERFHAVLAERAKDVPMRPAKSSG